MRGWWLNLRIGLRDFVCLSGVLHLLFCSIVFYFLSSLFFTLPLPLPVRDEVMQRGEQLFIPSPSSNIRVMIRLEKTRKRITHLHSIIIWKSKLPHPSSLSFTTFFFSLRNMSIVRALYIILIRKPHFYFNLYFLFSTTQLLLPGTTASLQHGGCRRACTYGRRAATVRYSACMGGNFTQPRL